MKAFFSTRWVSVGVPVGLVILATVTYKWGETGFSHQRVRDVACRVAGKIVDDGRGPAERTETLRNIREMLASPKVSYRGLPFKMKTHAKHGMNTIQIHPESSVREGYVLVNGRQVRRDQLDSRTLEALEEVDNELRRQGAKPMEPEEVSLLEAMGTAWRDRVGLVVCGERGEDIRRVFRKASERADGERYPGLVIIVVTDSISQTAMNLEANRFGAECHVASYRFSPEDLLSW